MSTSKNNFSIPKRVTIETIFGCNASCIMCPIDLPTSRPKGIMPMDLYKKVIDSLEPYKEKFEKVDLFGLGEPLLDPQIFDRLKYVKEKGFSASLGFSTNANLLNSEKQKKLLESGIDFVIFSIDGVQAETHESIRRKTKFSQVMENVLSTIHLRNEGNYKTRFMVRFIRQDRNRSEWDEYSSFWKTKLNFEHGDLLSVYNAHNWGGECGSKEETLKASGWALDEKIEKRPCHKPFQNLIVLADGSVPMCDEDFHHGKTSFGNVKEQSVIDIWNSEAFNKTRELHRKGNKSQIEMCSKCTVLYSEPAREVINHAV